MTDHDLMEARSFATSLAHALVAADTAASWSAPMRKFHEQIAHDHIKRVAKIMGYTITRETTDAS